VTLDQIASILWRRRRVFAVTVVLCMAIVAGITFSLSKTYRATTTLLVSSEQRNFATTDLLEQLTRTYAHLAGNPNVAANVIKEIDPPISRSELLSRMSFSPVERTPLLQISAEGGSPEQAANLANLYSEVFVERISARAEAEASGATVSISEPAALPTDPVRPNPPLYLGLGALLSILIAFGVTLAVDRMDTRVTIPEHEATFLGQPILGRVPKFELRGGEVPREITDLFALIKTNLEFLGDGPTQALMVTSAGVEAGTSTVATCLASACVAEGERVVLIEADLRRPTLEHAISLQGTRASRWPVGLSSYLTGAATHQEILASDRARPGVRIIWAGPTPPNPMALLKSDRFDALLDLLRPHFERIIIDAPAVSAAADATLLVPRVDGVIYVIDESSTSQASGQAGLNQLTKVRAPLLGVIVNRSRVAALPQAYVAATEETAVVEASRRRARRPARRR
jgi:capsular exopolysaccharide synthesis family protein